MADKMQNKYINAKNQKVQKENQYKKTNRHLRLGMIVYFLLLAYLFFCVVSFSFSKKTNYTLAEPGKIIESETFTGMVIRNETIINSTISGNTNYFVPEGEKVKKGTLVSVIDTEGNITAAIETKIQETIESEYKDVTFSKNNYKYLQDQLKSYVVNKSNNDFDFTYSARADIENAISDISNTVVFDNDTIRGEVINSEILLELTSANDDNFYFAPTSGVVSYYLDGFEDLTIDTFSPKRLDESITVMDTLKVTSTLEDEPLFKIIDNYKWYIASEINDVCEKYLEGRKYVTLQIKEKNITFLAKINQIINEDAKTYIVLEFDRYINEFIKDRLVDFTIVYNQSEGIKIPISAVTTKQFLEIPIEAIISNNNKLEVKKKINDPDAIGGESLVGINVYMFYEDDKYAYVPLSEDLKIGDTIVYGLNAGENTDFVIQNQISLDGVYVINKGFASFKLIETLSFNDEYRIIDDNTAYGVCIYDRIATDSTTLKENEIIE